MPASIEDRRKAVQYLVHDVFVKAHNRQFALFLVQYTETIRRSILLSAETGIPINLSPTVFDITKPCDDLVAHILTLDVLTRPPDGTPEPSQPA